MATPLSFLKQLIICAVIPSILSLAIGTILIKGGKDRDAQQQLDIATLRQELHAATNEQKLQDTAAQLPQLTELKQQIEQLLTRQEQLAAQYEALKALTDAPLNTMAEIQRTLHELGTQNAQLMADNRAARQNAALPLRKIDELSSKIEQLQMDIAYLYAESNASRQHLISLQNMLLQHSSEAHRSTDTSETHINWGDKGDLLKAGYKILRDKGGHLLEGVQDFVDQQRADSMNFPAE